MNNFLALPISEKHLFITEAATKYGISPVIIEKDFWVCYVLEQLFQSPYGEKLTFKGGTSLSKAYKIIERFSEDIDLVIDKDFINSFGNATSISPSKITKQCKKVIKNHLLSDLQNMLKEHGTCELDIKDEQTILFFYSSCLEQSKHEYILKQVKIELGARGERVPSEGKIITPYLAEILPEIFDGSIPQIVVTTLMAERTFWEKATILHSIAHQPEDRALQPRMCRHYHDLYMLSQDEKILNAALSNKDLLEQVVNHKKLYFKEKWDWYSTAKMDSLKLLPPTYLIQSLKTDYEKTKTMFFNEPITFNKLMDGLKKLEDTITKNTGHNIDTPF